MDKQKALNENPGVHRVDSEIRHESNLLFPMWQQGYGLTGTTDYKHEDFTVPWASLLAVKPSD